MRLLLVLLLVGLLGSPALSAKGDPSGEKREIDRSGRDCGKHGAEFGAPDQGETDWAWYVVDASGRRLSLPFEFRGACEPQLRSFAGAVRCAWVRR